MAKKTYYGLTKYLLLFMAAAFVGWVYEIVCVYFTLGRYVDRGVLHLPMCPIYGFGMLLLYVLFHRFRNVFVLFFGSALVTTAVELAASYVIERKFHTELWSYEEWPLNYQGRICVISSAAFGLLALFFFKALKPCADWLFRGKARIAVSVITVALFVFCVVWEMRFR
ncbi:MAG: putative ABC transporter permease [Lachnospiraceae bacterium]|nr:putative ABC transporter permease [Lachnospiraceae bacterium]